MEKKRRGSWRGYISPREKWGQGKCRIGSRGCFHVGRDGGHALRNGENQTPGGVLDPVTGECKIECGRDRRQSSLQRYVSF